MDPEKKDDKESIYPDLPSPAEATNAVDKKDDFEMKIDTDNNDKNPRETFNNKYELYAALIAQCFTRQIFTLVCRHDLYASLGKLGLD